MPEKKITLAGKEFTLLPCPAVGMKAIGKNLHEIGRGSDAGFDALIDAIYYGVKRGIPTDSEFTRDFVAWNIDSTNVLDLTNAFAEVNGVVPKQAQAAGEPSGEV